MTNPSTPTSPTTPQRHLRRWLAWPVAVLLTGGAAALLGGCEREDLYGGSSFTENVAEAYADCSDAEIRFLAAKNGIQTAFENCGSNKFGSFTWSPDGRLLYFNLTYGGHILDGESKALTTVPTETPIAKAAWLRSDLLAVPLGPPGNNASLRKVTTPDGEAVPVTSAIPTTTMDAQGADTPMRLAIYNLSAQTLNVVHVKLTGPRDLQSFGDGERVLLTALDDQGVRRPYTIDPSTGEAVRAFEWLTQPVEHLSYSPKANLLGWSDGKDAELFRADDGSSIAVLPDVVRVLPHQEGRFVALETLGAAISPFDQRHWNEVTVDARERELARQAKWLERQPDWVPKEIVPPEVQILDLSNGSRYRVTYLYGDHFEWYPARNYFYSVMLWGIEGKQLNRNVALADLAERLRMLDKGEVPLGMEIITAGSETADAGGDGAEPAAAEAADADPADADPAVEAAAPSTP